LNRSFDRSRTSNTQESALVPLFNAIRAHSLAVALVTLAAVGASIAFIALRSPQYEATADVLVEPLSQEDEVFVGLPLLRDTGDPVRTVETAASLMESHEAAQRTADELGRDWTSDEVLEDVVDVTPAGESNILAVTATADTPEEAATTANEFARAALEVRNEELSRLAESLVAQLDARLEAVPASDEITRAELAARRDQVESVAETGDPTLVLAQPALAPTSSTGAAPALIILLALLAGLTLGAGTALALELVNPRIRNEDEAVELYPLPILSRVPMLKGRELRTATGPEGLMPPRVRESFRTLVTQVRARRSRGVVMVTSASTGDGKTTSAVNLAETLASGDDRVILLDLDLRKPDVSRVLGIQNRPEGLRSLRDSDAALEDLLISVPNLPTLSVLPTTTADAAGESLEEVNRILPALLEQARAVAAWVVVDTAPLGEVSDALQIAPHADEIVIVTRPGNTNRANFEMMRDLLERTPGADPSGLLVITQRDMNHGPYYYGAGIESRPLRMSARR
jgi:Mrp family chromosome partitioning ATPase/capsular polysaccharide biosynthesis protein